MLNDYKFTSESVTEGHPDKVADQISDAILDAILAKDPMGRVACETLITTGLVVVAGEITTGCYIDIPSIVRTTLMRIGYTGHEKGFDAHTCGIVTSIQKQSPDIALGVDTGGAGDQGMMFGYASDETPEMMPMAIVLAHRITSALARLRKGGMLDYLRPDGKSQVTIEYRNGRPHRIDAIVVSAHHSARVSQANIKADITKWILQKNEIVPQTMIDAETKVFVNPTGSFIVGGPQADTGVTGRKIIADTYGGAANHGGGAFSGKDPSKVDRSAAYMARCIAKNIVRDGLAKRCEVQLAYAIGVAEPVSVLVNTFGTASVPQPYLERFAREGFNLTPAGIIETLNLRRPIYEKTASYGHFGRMDDADFTWETFAQVREDAIR